MNKLTQNTKTAKAPKDWENYIMHLSPMNKAFKVLNSSLDQVNKLVKKRMKRNENLTRFEFDTSGRGKFSNVQIARAAKTIHKILDSDGFDLELIGEIERKALKAQREGKKIAIRLNGTSDLDFSLMIIQHFDKSYKLKNGAKIPKVQFYDYCKSQARFLQYQNGALPENYHLTYSYDRKNDKDPSFMLSMLNQGAKVAIMAGDLAKLEESIPEDIFQFKSIDGDKHDLRFFDTKVKGGAFVILQEKGDAKK